LLAVAVAVDRELVVALVDCEQLQLLD